MARQNLMFYGISVKLSTKSICNQSDLYSSAFRGSKQETRAALMRKNTQHDTVNLTKFLNMARQN